MLHNARTPRAAALVAHALVIIATLPGCPAAHAVEQPTLAATVIDGATAYTPTELFRVYRDQLGRPITPSGAQAILAQIEALYLRDGHSRPQLRLDEDLAATGILRIEVFEARITQVMFSGDPGPYAAQLEELASDLTLRPSLRSADLQAALQAMRELPGLSVRANIRRDETQRNGHALAIATEYKPLDGTLQLSNRGTSEIGPMFAFGNVVANGVLGYRERFGLLASAAADTHEYSGGGAFVDVPVGDSGTHLTTSMFSSRANPSERPDRDDRYERQRVVLRAAGTIDPAAPVKLGWSLGLDWDDLDILRNGERLRGEQLRIAEVGAKVSGRSGPSGQYLLALQARRGLDGFGSALEAHDLLDDPRRQDFWLTRLQFTHLLRFAQRWSIRVDAFGQQSAYVLPDSERYKIGGERLGRGFEVAEIAGDQGAGAKAELRREMTAAATPLGKTSLYGFYDLGAAWKQDEAGRESAATSGLGLAIELGRLSGFIEVAKPLTRADIEGDRDAKVFAEIKVKL